MKRQAASAVAKAEKAAEKAAVMEVGREAERVVEKAVEMEAATAVAREEAREAAMAAARVEVRVEAMVEAGLAAAVRARLPHSEDVQVPEHLSIGYAQRSAPPLVESVECMMDSASMAQPEGQSCSLRSPVSKDSFVLLE